MILILLMLSQIEVADTSWRIERQITERFLRSERQWVEDGRFIFDGTPPYRIKKNKIKVFYPLRGKEWEINNYWNTFGNFGEFYITKYKVKLRIIDGVMYSKGKIKGYFYRGSKKYKYTQKWTGIWRRNG